MLVKRFYRLFLGFWGALALPAFSPAQTLPATIVVNAGVTVTSFVPISIFGNNTAYWISNSSNQAVQPKVQAAGNYFLRYPGGSSSDDYHWNGTGSFDANGYWVPSGTTYTYGFVGNETWRGTTSSYGTPSHVTDGSASTTWMSNVDTDFPNAQWVELNLAASSAVNAVTLTWGTPYATSFQIQYWPSAGWPPPLNDNASNKWISAVTVTGGTGGTQGVTFIPRTAQYFRIFLTASSAGAGGAYAMAEAALYNGATQVSVNTSNATSQTAAEASSTDPASSLSYTTNPPGSTDFESYMTYVNSFSPRAIPLITVNVGTGTAQEAASWVHYANTVKGYGIKYWQIGNETEGSWETGGPLNAQDFVRRYIEYYNAMKAVDPTILITGPVSGSFLDTSNLYDGKSYVQDFIALLAAKGLSGDINAIDYHWYPNYGNYTAAQALASTSSLDSYPVSLDSWLTAAGVASPSTVPVLMTEFNVDPGDENFQVQLGNGLWVADALGHFIAAFGSRGFTNLWDTLNGGSDHASATGGDLGYLDNSSPAYQPHASYWAMQMMTNHWAVPGDTQNHQMVSTTVTGAPASLFAAYSDFRPDGVFSLLVVNKNPAGAYAARVSGLPFVPNSTASGWVFNSSNYAWVTTGGTPYHASPDTAPTTFTLSGVSSAFPVTFQPYSITVLQFTNSGQATNTPTVTPTITSTPTITPTPDYGPATLVDDFEDLSRDGTPPSRTNLWSGTWGTSVAANSGITVQYGVTAAAGGTTYAVKATGNIGTAGGNGWSNYQSNLSPVWPPTAYNLGGAGIVGLQFWVYGDGNTYRMMVDSQAVTDFDNYGVNLTPPAGQWTFYQVPFSSMARQGWGGQTGLPVHPAGTDITGVQFSTQNTGAFSYELDQIAFYTASGVTPTATPTPTRTPTFTATPTPSHSPTASPTATPTSTATASPTGTWFTPTPTDSPTFTATSTSTATFSPTWTWTPTSTITSTPTATATDSMTATPFFTASPTPTFTPTVTSTAAAAGVLFPDPWAGNGPLGFYYNVDSPLDQVKVKIFTTAYRKIYEEDGLPTAPGRHSYGLDWNRAGLNPANGLYYVVLSFKTGGQETRQVMKLLVQR